MTIFRCPLCGGPLWEIPQGLRCQWEVLEPVKVKVRR